MNADLFRLFGLAVALLLAAPAARAQRVRPGAVPDDEKRQPGNFVKKIGSRPTRR